MGGASMSNCNVCGGPMQPLLNEEFCPKDCDRQPPDAPLCFSPSPSLTCKSGIYSTHDDISKYPSIHPPGAIWEYWDQQGEVLQYVNTAYDRIIQEAIEYLSKPRIFVPVGTKIIGAPVLSQIYWCDDDLKVTT